MGMGLGAASARHLLGQRHAALARQHPVQQDHVGQHGVQLALRRFAVFRPGRLEAVVAQVDGDQLGNRGLVFNDQDAGLAFSFQQNGFNWSPSACGARPRP
jgi:hypothetical protein